jgi:hypothetical protein
MSQMRITAIMTFQTLDVRFKDQAGQLIREAEGAANEWNGV